MACTPASTGTRGSGHRCSRGSRTAASRRRRRAASSTSASVCARSSPKRRRVRSSSEHSSDRRARLRPRHEPPGARRRRAADRRGRVQPRRRSRARARRRPHRRLRALRLRRPRAARRGDGRMAEGAERRAHRARRIHARAHAGISRCVPRCDRQRPPVAPPGLPRHARGRGPARRGRHRVGRKRAPRRPRRRQRPGACPGARARPPRRHTGNAARADQEGRAPSPAEGGGRAVRALISTYDKTGLDAFARGPAGLGWSLVASGGTASYLEGLGLLVEHVEALTESPEMLGGRVKTLHPRIHAGILARRDHAEDVATLEDQAIEPFDLVCVNLYPFEQVAARQGVTEAEAVEMIDVGGPSMLRGAAKNFAHVVAVCRPDRYGFVLDELERRGEVSLDTRRELAAEAFATTAAYEAAIAGWFAERETFPETLVLAFDKVLDLSYGENPHQRAAY